MTVMTVMLESVSRKTLKKPLVSRWYSVGTRPVMMVLMSVTEPRLKPHCVEPQIFTKLYTHLLSCLKAAQQLEIILVLGLGDVGFKFSLALANLEQNMDILVLYMFWG